MLPHLQPSRPTTASPNPPVTPPLTHTRNYNPAVRHPAFFTERLHRAPSRAAAATATATATAAAGSSPVTAGYAYAPAPAPAPAPKAAGAKL